MIALITMLAYSDFNGFFDTIITRNFCPVLIVVAMFFAIAYSGFPHLILRDEANRNGMLYAVGAMLISIIFRNISGASQQYFLRHRAPFPSRMPPCDGYRSPSNGHRRATADIRSTASSGRLRLRTDRSIASMAPLNAFRDDSPERHDRCQAPTSASQRLLEQFQSWLNFFE